MVFFKSLYLTSEGVPTDWNGDLATCQPGRTSQTHQDATLRRINYYRAMAGLPANLTLDDDWNSKCQQTALMMSAQGNASHTPEPGWKCYTRDAAEAAGKSSLSLGEEGPAAINGYMDDPGPGNYFVGHRRWLLYPPQKTMGTGSVPAQAGHQAAHCLWVIGGFGSRPSEPAWVAWPPDGFIPYQVLPRRSQRWSFSYTEADFSQATVAMESSGTALIVNVEPKLNDQGYGDNTIVWRPEGVSSSRPTADTTYLVTIKNVLGLGQPRTFRYSVTIIDPDAPDEVVPPQITRQPVGVTVTEGETAGFSVEATGSEPLSYRWRLHGEPLEGATTPIYQLPAARLDQAGSYDVVVSNSAGEVISDAVTLTVLPAPAPGFQSAGIEGDRFVLRWSGRVILQRASTLQGPWMDIFQATSPYAVRLDGETAFFRLRAR